jgi:RNA polymerase sigma factor (sigma-70 family)
VDYSAMTDEELLTRYYEGDDLAFAELHRRYLAQLRAAAFRRLPRTAGRREAADELAAQALVRVALTRQRTTGRWNQVAGQVRPWLFTIMHNEVTGYLRRSGHELPTSDLPGSRDSGEERRLEELLTADDLAPLEGLLQEELQAALRACIEELPEALRQVVTMLLDGLRQTDIAEALGISDATAMRHRHRAYALLIECLRRI